MCAHSLDRARARGFRSMQFNFVVSTNERAVLLWQSFGFEIVGRLPGAFQHPTAGYVDAFVMSRPLEPRPGRSAWVPPSAAASLSGSVGEPAEHAIRRMRMLQSPVHLEARSAPGCCGL